MTSKEKIAETLKFAENVYGVNITTEKELRRMFPNKWKRKSAIERMKAHKRVPLLRRIRNRLKRKPEEEWKMYKQEVEKNFIDLQEYKKRMLIKGGFEK